MSPNESKKPADEERGSATKECLPRGPKKETTAATPVDRAWRGNLTFKRGALEGYKGYKVDNSPLPPPPQKADHHFVTAEKLYRERYADQAFSADGTALQNPNCRRNMQILITRASRMLLEGNCTEL